MIFRVDESAIAFTEGIGTIVGLKLSEVLHRTVVKSGAKPVGFLFDFGRWGNQLSAKHNEFVLRHGKLDDFTVSWRTAGYQRKKYKEKDEWHFKSSPDGFSIEVIS